MKIVHCKTENGCDAGEVHLPECVYFALEDHCVKIGVDVHLVIKTDGIAYRPELTTPAQPELQT